jgi:predicted negative regulator of RcsB-dependent stress response
MDPNDRQRLQQVQQTDITESRINDDFLFWLKNSGPTYLLVLLVGLCVFLGWQRWAQYQQGKADAAWRALAEVQGGMPVSLVEVADDPAHAGVDAVALLARLEAAGILLNAVQLDDDPDSTDPAVKLTDEKRREVLERADALYAKVAADAGAGADRSIHAVNALFGRAAIAESRGELDPARSFYNDAATRAQAMYPELAAAAQRRAGTVGTLAQVVRLPSAADVARPASARQPVAIDDTLRMLIEGAPTMTP